MKSSWSLDPKEVLWAWNGSSSGKAGQFERKLKTTSGTITLTHPLTSTMVIGEIPAGNYSKKEIQQKRDDLHKSLFIELESLVAKKLRISGFKR